MKVVAVIPARWQSSRLKGKVLMDINGKPMVQHVWERAKKAKQIDDVIIAVDKEKVMKRVKEFGAKAVITSSDHLAQVIYKNMLKVLIQRSRQYDNELDICY